MTIGTESLGHKFTVSAVSYESDTDMRINIKKRKIRIFHRTLTSEDRVNITHLVTQKTNPVDNLFISDRSGSLIQNTVKDDLTEYTVAPASVFTSKTKEFVVTNVFTTEKPTKPATPLFYYHKLKYFNSDLTDWSYRTLLSVEFTNYVMEKHNTSEYYIDSSTGKVYNNLSNSYNVSTGEFEVFYVRYSVKVNDGSTITQYNYHELLNNQKAFHLAEVADLDDFGNLDSESNAYILEELPDLSGYRITLPSSTSDYAYKEISPSRLYLKNPVAIDVSDPWTIRVSNGEFTSSVRDGVDSYKACKYKIAEFNSQTFDPYPPYKLIRLEEATWLYDNLFKVTRNIVDNNSTGFYVDVFVYDEDDTLTYQYSTNTSKVGTTQNSIEWTAGILSVGEPNGFIELIDSIPGTYKVLVTYYTESAEYDFIDIDFNPVSNRDILNKRVVFYVAPETTKTGSLSNTLFYLEVNRKGIIKHCSQAETGGTDYATLKLLSEDFNSDGSPKDTFYYDRESTLSGLRYRTSGVFQAYKEYFSFIDKYTVENRMAKMSIPSGEYLANLQENPQFLVLGDVYLGEISDPDFGVTYEMRERGGGIKEDYETLARAQQSEILWYWDNEVPYPGNMTYMVEVPNSIKKEYGGDFDVWDIQDISSRHAQAGTYPIVRNYGLVDPVISSGTASSIVVSGVTISGVIDIYWPSYGPDVTYDVYLSNHEKTGFTKQNDSSLSDNSGGNSYTMRDKENNITFYLYVTGTKDGETSKGPIVSITTTSYT